MINYHPCLVQECISNKFKYFAFDGFNVTQNGKTSTGPGLEPETLRVDFEFNITHIILMTKHILAKRAMSATSCHTMVGDQTNWCPRILTLTKTRLNYILHCGLKQKITGAWPLAQGVSFILDNFLIRFFGASFLTFI